MQNTPFIGGLMKEPIGNKLKAIRVAKKMTQAEFAELIGISRQWYNPIETNRLTPTDAVIGKIEKALGVKLNDPQIEEFMSIGKSLAIAA
jgi:transcriptional regulator with XRE-family HTH domain